MAEDGERDVDNKQPQVAFDYIKGHLFRVVHADGVIGGATPNSNVHLAFFSERGAIPKREVRSINPDGTLGGLVDTDVRKAIVREIDFDVIMSLSVAEALVSWLQERVSEIKSLIPSAENEDGREPK